MAEHQWEPDWVVSPAEMLQEWMKERELSVRVLALACGRVPVAVIKDVLAKKPFDEETARVLATGTHIAPQFWLALEHNYRYGLAHGKTDLEDQFRQPQDATTGAAAVFGKWPGDESEEELLKALEEME